MPYTTLGLAAIAVVLGTLAVSPLPSDDCIAVFGSLLILCAYAFSNLCRPARLRLVLIAALAGGGVNAILHASAAPNVYAHRTQRYAGTVVDCAGSSLAIALDNGLTVAAAAGAAHVACGSRLVLRGRLSPFDENRNPYEPSERQLQYQRGFDARIEAATILRASPGCGGDSRAWLACAHEWAHAQLAQRLGEPSASVVAGELWGERSALPPDLRREFTETGTVHVLVTAGLHFGAVAALTLGVLSLISLPRAVTCALAIACIWLFVVWSGGHLPAMRAATMATAALAARACGRAAFSWNALAIAALAVAVVRPSDVATASFALSFSCVGAIFALAAPLERRIDAVAALPRQVREALVLSLATQLGTWPLTAAVFLQFAPYALPANLAVVPCVAATMGMGALQLVLTPIPPLAQAVANINSWLLAWMLSVVRGLAALPVATIPMTPPPAWCIVAYDAALLVAPYALRAGARTCAMAASCIAVALILWPPRPFEHRLRITMLDVGQADGIVVQTPSGRAFIVDAGGRLERGGAGDSTAESIGERIVVPFLLRSGIHELDALILSHPHGDHAGGAAPVLRTLRVTTFADGGQSYGGRAYHDALDVAHAHGVPIVYPRAGARWSTADGVTLQFLGPSWPFIKRSRNDINENSLAFLLRYHAFCMLFTGDAGASAERRFLSEGDIGCTVLKVGHHGSAYGSTPEFIAAVRPRYALISVGRHNLFGHPAPSTIEILRRAGAAIYRTDENGAIAVTSDGTDTAVMTQLTPSDASAFRAGAAASRYGPAAAWSNALVWR